MTDAGRWIRFPKGRVSMPYFTWLSFNEYGLLRGIAAHRLDIGDARVNESASLLRQEARRARQIASQSHGVSRTEFEQIANTLEREALAVDRALIQLTDGEVLL